MTTGRSGASASTGMGPIMMTRIALAAIAVIMMSMMVLVLKMTAIVLR